MSAETDIQGEWQMTRAELDGEKAPGDFVSKTQLVLSQGLYRVSFDGETTDEGTYENSQTAHGAVLTLHGVKGVNVGKSIPCIYQHVGLRLRICYGLDGILPTAFETTGLRDRYLASFRRMDSPIA
jgi:uncharacterized protein (TIGR03067 family)